MSVLIVLLHSRCWECLGDAYRTRGSYTTAMKAYSKALDYDPAAIYCQYQYVLIQLHLFTDLSLWESELLRSVETGHSGGQMSYVSLN